MKDRKLTRLVTLTATACLFCSGAIAGTFKNINIDGSFGDWAGVPVLGSDPQDNASGVDYADIAVANDDNYLYIRFTLYAAADPFTFMQNIFIDADNTPGTGYGANGLGSEMLIQSGAGYQEKNGAFNEGTINGLGWAAAPAGPGTQFEVRISRSAKYGDSTPVFSGDTIALLLEADSSPNEWAPPSPIVYTFESAPVALTTNLPLLRLTNSSWQVNAAGADIGTSWLDQLYDDTQAGWSAGIGLFGYTTTPGSYPAINTPLATGATTYYFRTHFNWNFLVDNLAFVVTNYLSDGAVLYLNGAEVRRVRMPAGTIGYNTNATGSASPVGAAEVFGISGSPLIIGDNILEVETHQAAGTAADMVFGLSLTAAAQYAVRNVNNNLPGDLTVVAGQSATFLSDVIGSGPLGYQWSHNGVNIPGATNANLTLTGVLTNDAGNYVLVTTNALGTNTTRTAVLTVTSTPVVINDPTQPADAYAVEGQPVTLSVFASGSPLVQYQWYRNNNNLIPDATNTDYTIPFLSLTNAGNYRVTISNPAGSTNSRTAALTVLRDKIPPVITTVAAAASRIVVSFSWPVDATTAGVPGNYTLSGGVGVSSAVINPNDATQVTLTTSVPLTSGTIYQLTINGVSDLFGNIAHTTVSFARTIIIDGSFDDWDGFTPVFSGPIGTAGAADFKDIYVYSDASRYCFRVTLWQDIAAADGHFPDYVDMFFDTDNDNTTGYPALGPVGSELLIESGTGYQEKNGSFNDNFPINGLDWIGLPATPGTNFEFSISRAATFSSDGTPVFRTNLINFQFVGLKTTFEALNRAPASGVISFTNMPTLDVPSLPPGVISIEQVAGGQIALVWDSGNLQARPSLSTGSWTNVPATSPHVMPASGTQMYFRLSN